MPGECCCRIDVIYFGALANVVGMGARWAGMFAKDFGSPYNGVPAFDQFEDTDLSLGGCAKFFNACLFWFL